MKPNLETLIYNSVKNDTTLLRDKSNSTIQLTYHDLKLIFNILNFYKELAKELNAFDAKNKVMKIEALISHHRNNAYLTGHEVSNIFYNISNEINKLKDLNWTSNTNF